MMKLHEFKKAAEDYLAENPTYAGWMVTVTEEVGYERTWHIVVSSPPSKDQASPLAMDGSLPLGASMSANTTLAAATATIHSLREAIDHLVGLLTS